MYIGTLLHYDSLLAHTLTNTGYKSIKYKAVLSFSQADELWKEWEDIYTDLSNDSHAEDAKAFFEAHKAEMLKGTEVLWEEKLSYYDLMKMRIDEERHPLTVRNRTNLSTRMTACSRRNGWITTTKPRWTLRTAALCFTALWTHPWKDQAQRLFGYHHTG